jgi:hypothetical protein
MSNTRLKERNKQDGINPIGQVISSIMSIFDEVLSAVNTIRKVLKDMDCMHFLSIVKITNAYYSLLEGLQIAGYVVAVISYIVFDGRVKSILLRVGDDNYPEVRVTPSYKMSSKEVRSKLKEISKLKWDLSNGYDGLLLVSVIVNR